MDTTVRKKIKTLTDAALAFIGLNNSKEAQKCLKEAQSLARLDNYFQECFQAFTPVLQITLEEQEKFNELADNYENLGGRGAYSEESAGVHDIAENAIHNYLRMLQNKYK